MPLWKSSFSWCAREQAVKINCFGVGGSCGSYIPLILKMWTLKCDPSAPPCNETTFLGLNAIHAYIQSFPMGCMMRTTHIWTSTLERQCWLYGISCMVFWNFICMTKVQQMQGSGLFVFCWTIVAKLQVGSGHLELQLIFRPRSLPLEKVTALESGLDKYM